MVEQDGVKIYILHLRDLEFINSQVIGCLAGVYSDLHGKGKKLCLAECNDHILDILNLVGFTNLSEHYENLKEAIDTADI